jgi:hypothetical protein
LRDIGFSRDSPDGLRIRRLYSWPLPPTTLAGRGIPLAGLSGVRRRFRTLSAWSPPGSSLGVFKDHPSIDTNPRRPLPFPTSGRPLVFHFGLPLPRTSPVPSSRFLTALPVFSVVDSAGLLHPAADHGIHRVAVFLLQPRGFRIPTFHDASPFEAFPSSVAGRSLRLSCPPTVRSPRKVRFQGFSPLIESVAFLECCHAGKSVAPMGFSSSTAMNHLFRPSTKHPEGCWVYGRISASLKAFPSRWISPKRTPRG